MNLDKLIIFLSTWSLVSIALVFISFILKNQIVLGNINISGYVSAVSISLIVTILGLFAPTILKTVEPRIKDQRYSIVLMSVGLLPLIWLIKKLSIYTGLGISNNIFVLIVSVLLSTVAFYGFKYSSHYLSKIQ